jgi:hypothetical protein
MAAPKGPELLSPKMSYAVACRTASYNFIFAVVLLVLYETAVAAMKLAGRGQVINGVDAMFEGMLGLIPQGTLILSVLIVLVGIFVIVQDQRAGVVIRPKYFTLMTAESLAWAGLFFFALPLLVGKLFGNQILAQAQSGEAVVKPGLLENIGLSLGAGFYEELFFRLILVGMLLGGVAIFGGNTKHPIPILLVVLVASALFSGAHYIGPLGDEFQLYSFVYRFIFGVAMSLLLVLRGFGITAWTHALYDVMVYTALFFKGDAGA